MLYYFVPFRMSGIRVLVILLAMVIVFLPNCRSEKIVLAKLTVPQIDGMFCIGRNSQDYREYIHNQTGMVFVYIPGGTFNMGSTDYNEYDNEKPIHPVTVSDFLIGKYEVTQGVWQKIMNENPSGFKKGDDYPVDSVSWYDCVTFCSKTGLRLPTEAEWEYACRAGTTTKYYWGDTENGDYMWYSCNSGDTTHPVGQKKPNGFGLYDMSGNVWEWCADWYGDNYYSATAPPRRDKLRPRPNLEQTSPQNNPKGPAQGQYRVYRGGCWVSVTEHCRSATRDRNYPTYRANHKGFRTVVSVK